MLVKSISFLPASMKSMKPMQKYSHIIELFVCTQKNVSYCALIPDKIQFLQEHIQHQNYGNK